MRKLLTVALLAAVAMPVASIPTAAGAQSNREVRRDRQDHREVRGPQRDHRGENLRDRRFGNEDWRSNRNRDRNLYARGNWRAPFRYNAFRPGLRIGANYFAPGYRINDPWRYHLPRPAYGQTWVRHYNDILLVDTRRGVVLRVIRNFYW